MSDHHTIQPAYPDRINLIQITDTHILGGVGELFDRVDTAATLSAVITAVNRLGTAPDAVLLTGDLVHDAGQAAYERLREQLERLSVPVFCLPGNHDEPRLMHTCLTGRNVHTAGSLSIGSWRVLLLDTWVPGSHAGRLSREELGFLDEQLRSMQEDHALVALHHPPVSIGSPWMDAMGLQNKEEFLAVIDACSAVRAVIWGHIHQEYFQQHGGVLLLGTPSTCIQFKPGADKYTPDDAPPAFRRLELKADGTVETQIHYVAV